MSNTLNVLNHIITVVNDGVKWDGHNTLGIESRPQPPYIDKMTRAARVDTKTPYSRAFGKQS